MRQSRKLDRVCVSSDIKTKLRGQASPGKILLWSAVYGKTDESGSNGDEHGSITPINGPSLSNGAGVTQEGGRGHASGTAASDFKDDEEPEIVFESRRSRPKANSTSACQNFSTLEVVKDGISGIGSTVIDPDIQKVFIASLGNKTVDNWPKGLEEESGSESEPDWVPKIVAVKSLAVPTEVQGQSQRTSKKTEVVKKPKSGAQAPPVKKQKCSISKQELGSLLKLKLEIPLPKVLVLPEARNVTKGQPKPTKKTQAVALLIPEAVVTGQNEPPEKISKKDLDELLGKKLEIRISRVVLPTPGVNKVTTLKPEPQPSTSTREESSKPGDKLVLNEEEQHFVDRLRAVIFSDDPRVTAKFRRGLEENPVLAEFFNTQYLAAVARDEAAKVQEGLKKKEG